jgi:hypothetical protein
MPIQAANLLHGAPHQPHTTSDFEITRLLNAPSLMSSHVSKHLHHTCMQVPAYDRTHAVSAKVGSFSHQLAVESHPALSPATRA